METVLTQRANYFPLFCMAKPVVRVRARARLLIRTMHVLSILFLCLPLLCLGAEEQPAPEGRLSEDKQIALLIQTSEQTLQQLKELQAALTAFRKQEAACIASPDDAESLYALSKCALNVLQSIRATHVEPYFRPAFLEELEKISRIAANKTIPPIGTP